MPIPRPGDAEDEKAFISRCMHAIGDEYDNKQAVAICYSAWRDKDKEGKTMDPRDALLKGQPVDCVYKAYPAEVTTNTETRTATFTVSTSGVDRDNDTIDPSGWDTKDFVRNPVIMWAHSYKDLPVARAKTIRATDKGLEATIEFPPPGVYPFADTVHDMVKAGFLNATSVGFRPIEWNQNAKRGGIDHIRQSLLEVSVVPIPSNQDALVAVRSKGITEAQLKEWATATKAWADGVLTAPAPEPDQKVGRVLSAKNEQALLAALETIQSVLAQVAAPAEETVEGKALVTKTPPDGCTRGANCAFESGTVCMAEKDGKSCPLGFHPPPGRPDTAGRGPSTGTPKVLTPDDKLDVVIGLLTKLTDGQPKELVVTPKAVEAEVVEDGEFMSFDVDPEDLPDEAVEWAKELLEGARLEARSSVQGLLRAHLTKTTGRLD